MANTTPLKYQKAVTIRVDEDFIEAVEEIRRSEKPIPTKSDAIRDAVLEKRERKRQAERRRNGR